MDAELRKVLSKLVLGIRHLLEGYYDDRGIWHVGDLEQRLNQLGVWRNRPAKPLEELPQLSETDNKARRTVDAYIKYREDIGVSRADAVEEFIQESAYTWFNRLFALRCMEARSIIDEVILQKDIYGGRSLQHNRLAIRHPELCAGEDDGLYAVLFQEFEWRAHDLPTLFNPESPAIALRPSVSIVKRLVSMLSGRESVNGNFASDEVFMAPDSFGWAYQYWNEDEKNIIFERVRTEKVKIEGKDIIPVTCIYTEPYMVKFLVHNSLGALWSCMHPESNIYKKWDYYMRATDKISMDLKPVSEITFLDPACGSGHFLLEAFDLFYDLYFEEAELIDPLEICASILNNNLFGIDIDERAIQISVAVIWMKAKARAPLLDTAVLTGFHDHFIATNIRLPKGRDHLEEFLRKHPEDRPLRSALVSIFESLENVDEIGSLLKFEEPLERAFNGLKTDYGIQMTLWTNGFTSMDSWRENVITQLREHFNKEATSSDASQAFFGQSVNKGLRLIDILSNKYDVVATNPPYMGSGNFGENLRKYIREFYYEGRSDLYACFIIRCISLVKNNGYISTVTQQSWMFLKYYSMMRKTLLNNFDIEIISQLGTGAFNEISGEVVNVALFTIRNSKEKDHYLTAIQLIGAKNAEAKEKLLKQIIKKNQRKIYKVKQENFLSIPESPLCYWLNEKFFTLLKGKTIRDESDIVTGLQTSNDKRFVRFNWETNLDSWKSDKNKRWVPFEKGGGYGKWYGFQFWIVDWEYDGSRIKATPSPRVQNTQYYFKPGYVYSGIASGSLGLRKLEKGTIFSARATSGVFPKKNNNAILSILNCRFSSVMTRAIAQNLQMFEGAVLRIPYPQQIIPVLSDLENKCIELKKEIIILDPLEKTFEYEKLMSVNYDYLKNIEYMVLLHIIEGYLENTIFKLYGLEDEDISFIINEAGMPVSNYPIVEGYDMNLNIVDVSYLYIMNKFDKPLKTILNKNDLDELKNCVRLYFETGENIQPEINEDLIENEDNIGSLIPIPPETLIEEISQITKIHPISIYWILREGIENHGWRSISTEQRIIQDRLSVIILHFLGHRWPQQIKAGEPIPDWADPDGIIPLTKCTNEPILLDRIRQRIKENFEKDSLRVEREFKELMNMSIEEWLFNDFFEHHQSQYKKRPVIWQIQSTPKGSSRRGRKQRIQPAFSCLVYCQKVDGDTLHKIRSQYVGPLKNGYAAELRTFETIGLLNTEQTTRRTKLELLIDELEEFDAKLQGVINEGFDSKELRELIGDEPLDSWCSIDGKAPPADISEGFYQQERAYIPDVNDGVRVNIAPLQKAGLLASDVLSKNDVERAIAERAGWRSDERRWCREGKIPQPGWWEKRNLDDETR